MESRSRTSHSASWKWWITGLLLLATTINYMDRVTLGSASVRVTHEFELSDQQYGNLELAFGWAFAAGSLVFGILSDRWSVYPLYPAILAGWSIMGMATAWSHGFFGLLACRTLLGFFEAGHWPCALKTTLALLSEKERTLGNSILQSGASIGAVVTPQLVRILMTDAPGSWRTPFLAVGACGLVWVVLWLIFLRPGDLPPGRAANTVADPEFGAILRGRKFRAVAILIFGAQIVWHMYRVWLMKFLQVGRGYPETEALNFNSLYFLAADLGCLAAGWAALRFIRRGGLTPHAARRAVYTIACGFTSLSLFLPWFGRGWLLLAVLLLVAAGALAMFPCYYSFVQEISVAHVGRITGLLSMWVWAITSPVHPLSGLLADKIHSYDPGLIIAGLMPWLGVAAMKYLWPSEPAPVEARV
jgi:ACS family hexuronate transporter-like MFS transporter